MRPTRETDLIQSLFAPLTLGTAGSFGLTDDVAFLPAAHQGLVITQDQVIEGTHFLASEPLEWAGRRLVRRNLSDLIAKGASPHAAFLSLAWPKARDMGQMAQFVRGLGDDLFQLCEQCPLMGGDTSTVDGPLVASLTLIGHMPEGIQGPVLRSGAQAGDRVMVTGTIGDAWLGLQARLGHVPAQELSDCIALSMAPCPPDVGLAAWIARWGSASIDVSDGLLADAAHLARQSGVGLVLELDNIPMSQQAKAWCQSGGDDQILPRLLQLATGGDDYQALVTLPAPDVATYRAHAQTLGVQVTDIGTVTTDMTLTLTLKGETIALPEVLGWVMG